MLFESFLSSLAPSTILCTFNERNLVVYDGTLRILFGFVHQDKSIEYSKEVKIIPSPPFPKSAKIIGVVVPEKPNFILLYGPHALYVVRLSSVLLHSQWCRLQADYYCDCYSLHASYLLQPLHDVVVEVRVVPFLVNGLCLVAILYSDNVIRFYDVNEKSDGLLLSADFAPFVLSGSNGENTFGLRKQLVTFDVATRPQNSTSSLWIVAADTESDLFGATIPFSSFNAGTSVEVYPLALNEPIPPEPIEIRFVEHSLSEVFQVMSLVCGKNIVSHFICMPNEFGRLEGFVHLQERLQLPMKSHMEQPKLLVASAGRTPGVYQIATGSALYNIDVSNWTSAFLADSAPSSSAPESVVSELLNVVGPVEATQNSGKLRVVQLQSASLVMEEEDDVDSPEATFVDGKSRDFLHVACAFGADCGRPAVFMAVSKVDWSTAGGDLQRRLLDEDLGKGEQSVKSLDFGLQIKRLLDGLIHIPAVAVTRTSAEIEAVAALLPFFDAVEHRFQLHQQIVDFASNRSLEVQGGLQGLMEMCDTLNNRIIEETNNVEDSKLQLFQLKEKMEMLRRRLNLVTSRIDENMPLSALEIRMYERLQEHQHTMSLLAIKIPQLNLEMFDQRKKTLTTRHFAENHTKKFAPIEKNTEDIANLKQRVEALKAEVSQLD